MRGRSQRYKDITSVDIERWLSMRKNGMTLQQIATIENVDYRKIWKETTLFRGKLNLPRSNITSGSKTKMVRKLKNKNGNKKQLQEDVSSKE